MSFRFQNWQVYKDTRSLRREFKEKIIVIKYHQVNDLKLFHN